MPPRTAEELVKGASSVLGIGPRVRPDQGEALKGLRVVLTPLAARPTRGRVGRRDCPVFRVDRAELRSRGTGLSGFEARAAALALSCVLWLPQAWSHEVERLGLAMPPVWDHKVVQDAFTDEVVGAEAGIADSVLHGGFSLIAGCRVGKGLRVGTVSGGQGLVSGVSSSFDVPVRFDDDEPTTRRFVAWQDGLMLDDPLRDAFLGEIAEKNRLRLKFPHREGDVVVSFSLAGSRHVLEEVARACGLLELENALARSRDESMAQYSFAIRAAVERNWMRPLSAPVRLAGVVRVTQARSGEVMTVKIVERSGNGDFDRSVEQAVWRASPLPLPNDASLFRRDL